MKQFIKFVTASCLGTILALGLLFMVLIAVSSVFSSKEMSIAKGSVLMLELNRMIPEKTNNVTRSQFDFESKKAIGVHRIKALIKKAQTDNNIKGIIYKAPNVSSAGMVTTSVIREAIEEFKDSTDKFVYSYADFYSNPTYLLATATDSIFVNPNGTVDINGYGSSIPFLKEGLDKLGVKMEVFYAGNFKSATEPLRRTNMSPENKQQTREFLGDYYNNFLDEITASRGISRKAVTDIINTLDFDNVDDCIENGLVDAKAYWYEVEDLIREKVGVGEGKKISYVSLDEYDSKKYISAGTSSNKIAVIYAEGDIMYDNNEKGVVSEVKYHKIFDKIRSSNSIKAIVLRVNSPGGSAFTSDVIWRELKELQAQGIPVVASFGDYAASGGYYIAARADKIVAHPNTLTGSIGVFSVLPNFRELANEKLGIRFDTVKTSPYAITLSGVYDVSDAERKMMQKFTDDMYQKFLSRVAEGRGKSVDEIHEVAQGRVWTGQRAQKLGLVDELGDLDRAIEIASELADLEDDYKVVEYPKIKKEIFEDLINEIMRQQEDVNLLSEEERRLLDMYNKYKRVLSYREPMARMPYDIILN